ncbi:MAG TPA: GNAT family N-acetyltransferase [Micromonosporaceae bacterium]
MELRTVSTDEDYETWRQVRIAVLPYERCATTAELRAQERPTRLMLLASVDGTVVGSGWANMSETEGSASVAPRVLPEFRRHGYGTALLDALVAHARTLDVAAVSSMCDDPGSMAFAEHFGFAEVNRQVEQVRAISPSEPLPTDVPEGIRVVTLDERPELWAACYDRFATEALADFAVHKPMKVSAEQWNEYWAGDPMFLALDEAGDVIGCAGVDVDTDVPGRGENALTAVRRDWRGRGIAAYLKRLTLHWAAEHGLTEVYTWTQRDNEGMRSLNEKLGYVYRTVSITASKPL